MKIFEIKNNINNNIINKKKSCVVNLNKKSIFINKKLLKINILKNIKFNKKRITSSFSIYKNNLKIKKIW